VRGDNKDPLTQFMIDSGIPSEPDVMKPDATTVFSFPMQAPEGAVCTADMTALDQLEMWLMYQRNWCEHKPSVTINVKSDEWFEVGAFVYKHFDEMSGVSFLPFNEHTYQQAPYQECTKSETVYHKEWKGECDEDGNEVYENTGVILTHSYESLLGRMPKAIDWDKLADYEKEDNTSGMQTMACTGDVCEMVDIT
jgi:ribonucleoside-diphosphate reductase alpha chain